MERFQVIDRNLWLCPGAIIEIVDGLIVGGQSHLFNGLTSYAFDDEESCPFFNEDDYAYVRKIDEAIGPISADAIREEFDQLQLALIRSDEIPSDEERSEYWTSFLGDSNA